MLVEFAEFIERVETRGGSLDAIVRGDIGERPLSGMMYALLERDLSSPDGAVSQSTRITETSFLAEADDISCEMDFRKIRLRDIPLYERRIDPDGSDIPDSIKDFASEHHGARYREYGILDGETVSLRIRKESYNLPPRPPSFKPQTRTNTVLLVERKSDDAGETGLSPLYRRWSY